MYNKGDLKLLQPPCGENFELLYTQNGKKFAMCDNYEHKHSIRDARTDEELFPPCAYLPHSCDEWVIGNIEQVKDLIIDLCSAFHIKFRMEDIM